METSLNPSKGVRVKRQIKQNYFMLDFRHAKNRYRLVTTYVANEDNLPRAQNLLYKLKQDLDKDRFFLSNYERFFKNPEILEPLDLELTKALDIKPMSELIQKELDDYKTRVAVATLGLATYENYIYAANLHTLPYFNNFNVHEVTGEVLEEFIRKLPLPANGLN